MQSMIVRVSQDFVGLAWVRYDAAFRRQEALTGNTQWSVINSTLYTMCFTGHVGLVCGLGLSSFLVIAFRWSLTPGSGSPDWEHFPSMCDVAKHSSHSFVFVAPKLEVCRKWNSSFSHCKYSHTCSVYRGDHPASR